MTVVGSNAAHVWRRRRTVWRWSVPWCPIWSGHRRCPQGARHIGMHHRQVDGAGAAHLTKPTTPQLARSWGSLKYEIIKGTTSLVRRPAASPCGSRSRIRRRRSPPPPESTKTSTGAPPPWAAAKSVDRLRPRCRPRSQSAGVFEWPPAPSPSAAGWRIGGIPGRRQVDQLAAASEPRCRVADADRHHGSLGGAARRVFGIAATVTRSC